MGEGEDEMEEIYPRHIKQGATKPFDPLKLAVWTEGIVCKPPHLCSRGKMRYNDEREDKCGGMRRYTDFYCTGVYGGISTGYAVGCCLRCIFCWVNFSRDFPEKFGRFYSSQDVFEQLLKNAEKKGVKKMRVSGGEPTLCREHLIGLLNLICGTDYLFILETNGIPFGNDEEYVERLTKYKNIHVRVSLKAGTPEGFEKRTGAMGKFYELHYNAIRYLIRKNIPFHVAAMSDPRLMPSEERDALLKKLKEIGYKDYLEEEACNPYPHAIYRLKEAGVLI